MDETLVSSETVYPGRMIKVRVDVVKDAQGREKKREIVEHPDAVAVVALVESDTILLVQQYRRATEKALWEIPAGKVDPGETEEQAAARECVEETGFRPRKLERLAAFYASPGFCTEKMYVYLGTDVVASDGVNVGEIGEVRRVSMRDAVRMVESGEIEDAKSVVGIVMASHRLAGAR